MREKALFLALFLVLFISCAAVINVSAPDSPKIFIDPSSIIDLSKVSGKYVTVNVNVSNVIKLWAYEFYVKWDPTLLDVWPPPSKPVTNMNFTTTTSTAWVTSTTITSGTATYGYDSLTGNPFPGSDLPSYYHKATSTADQTASITFVTEQSFEWGSGLPSDVIPPTLSYAYKISGNSFGSSTLSVILVKPDSSTLILDSVSHSAEVAWTYKTGVTIQPSHFLQRGIYKLQFKSVSTTSAVGTGNYIQVNWDDVGLKILASSPNEGLFLKQGGSTFFANRPNATEGWIYITNTLQGQPYIDSWPVSGSGTLVTITFKVKKLGSTILDLYDTILRDDYLDPMGHTVQDGYFSNKMAGDANGDKTVNSADLSIVAAAYGSKFGEVKYDVRADFNGDESVDVKDAYLLAVNYGKSY